MKKLIRIMAFLLACLLLFSACTPAEGQGTTTTAPSQTTPTTIRLNIDEDGVGGLDDWDMQLSYIFEFSIESAVYSLVEKDKFDAWFSTFKQWNENGTREAYEMNMYTLITEFSIPRSEIERICEENKQMFGDDYFTEEQVDAIYTKTEEEVYRLFANPYAVMVGKRAYSPKWMVEHKAEEYLAAGITYDILSAEFEDLLTPCTEEQRTYLRAQLTALQELDNQ